MLKVVAIDSQTNPNTAKYMITLVEANVSQDKVFENPVARQLGLNATEIHPSKAHPAIIEALRFWLLSADTNPE